MEDLTAKTVLKHVANAFMGKFDNNAPVAVGVLVDAILLHAREKGAHPVHMQNGMMVAWEVASGGKAIWRGDTIEFTRKDVIWPLEILEEAKNAGCTQEEAQLCLLYSLVVLGEPKCTATFQEEVRRIAEKKSVG